MNNPYEIIDTMMKALTATFIGKMIEIFSVKKKKGDILQESEISNQFQLKLQSQ